MRSVHAPTARPAVRATARQRAADPIDFVIGESSLGLVLVAWGAGGLCAVLLGDDHDALQRELHARFPLAPLTKGADASCEFAARVLRCVESPARELDVPLDLRGTAFQRTVWGALRAIPAGSTASYTDVAMRIGAPGAVRAVAQACAANPVAVVVPCHRVVKSDGALSGYRWGVARKRALLDREGGRVGARRT